MKLTFAFCCITMTISLAVAVAGTVSAGQEAAALVEAGQVSRVGEKFDRGIVALRRTDGTVYVGWRLLAEDPADIVFDVYRTSLAAKTVKLATLDEVTNFIDRDVPTEDILTYWVVARSPGREPAKSKTVTVDMRQEPRDYLSVPLEPGVRGFMQPTVADLDGNGSLDYVIKTPDSYIDPGGSAQDTDANTATERGSCFCPGL